MALIDNIVGRYEQQNQAMYAKRNNPSYSGNRDDIFLQLEKRGDPVGEDKSSALGSGNLWKAQKVGLYRPAKVIEKVPEPVKQSNSESLQQEVERLRQENTDLRTQLESTQKNYA